MLPVTRQFEERSEFTEHASPSQAQQSEAYKETPPTLQSSHGGSQDVLGLRFNKLRV